jgi:outer membrane receptor for ferrienterochelin and colicin
MSTDIFASGAIIDDTLFFYGLYEFRNFTRENLVSAGNSFRLEEDDDPYYLARLDWNVNDNHSLMAWYFKDESAETTTDFKYDDGNKTDPVTSTLKTGGTSWSIRYTGQITDDLSVSAMAGKVEFQEITQSSSGECPAIYDNRSGSFVKKGCFGSFFVGDQVDERNQYRLDFDYYLNDSHNVRFGVDVERNEAYDLTNLSGGVYYLITNYEAGTALPNGATVAETSDFARVRYYNRGGTFKINNAAYYIEDIWSISDRLTATIGLRWESFENLNADGDTFIEMNNQFAPRLGLSYDLFDDGDHKLFF